MNADKIFSKTVHDRVRKKRTFAGFGFGAIQAGLFLYEAFQTKNFDRLVVAEVMPEVVAAIRRNGGYYVCNIAHANRVEATKIGPIQIENPTIPQDRARLVNAIAAAEEIGTAIPGVDYYVSDGPESVYRILAAGLRQKAMRQGPRAIIYTAENHNHAAEILQAGMMAKIPPDEQAVVLSQVQFLNTVIGKMSGIVANPAQFQTQGLTGITPEMQRAFLVEAFNQILISKIQFDGILFKR